MLKRMRAAAAQAAKKPASKFSMVLAAVWELWILAILTVLVYKAIRWVDACISIGSVSGLASTIVSCLIGGLAAAIIASVPKFWAMLSSNNTDVIVSDSENAPTNTDQDA